MNLALPPGTPNGACLLRCSLSAAHSDDQIAQIRQQFAEIMQDMAAQAVEAGRAKSATGQ